MNENGQQNVVYLFVALFVLALLHLLSILGKWSKPREKNKQPKTANTMDEHISLGM